MKKEMGTAEKDGEREREAERVLREVVRVREMRNGKGISD